MFTAALFIIAQIWKRPKCPLRDEWIKKMCTHTHTHTHTMEYYSAIRKNKIMASATTRMDLGIIIFSKVSEVSQRKTNIT